MTDDDSNLDRFGWASGQLSYIDANGKQIRIGEITAGDQKMIDKLGPGRRRKAEGASDAEPPPAPPVTTLDLDDDERAALIGLLRRALDDARYPLAPRWAAVKAILARLDPQPAPELPTPIRSGLTPRVGRGRRR